ncbi:MAG: hypothetical protein ACWA5X_10170 [bacterium]
MSDTDMTETENAPLSFDAADSEESRRALVQFLEQQQQKLATFPPDGDPLELATTKLDLAEAAVGLSMMEEAWTQARQAFNIFLENEKWQQAVECTEILYRTDQPASVVALGQGMWLSVTYPVDPQLTLNMMSHFVDDTPPKADGAALAAIVAHYVADMRLEGEARDNMIFLTNNLVYSVAERHSGVKDQESFSRWMERLELLEPEKFLKRFGLVIGAIVPNEEWWFDRDELRSRIPDQ